MTTEPTTQPATSSPRAGDDVWITVRVKPQTLDRLEEVANRFTVPRSTVIRWAVELYLANPTVPVAPSTA